ncbi:hypothetical protein [Streptomyces sp. NPDC053048]|uniref:zinc finger domain-containing protein n=1 Tax=Streptomyces sp. NPDC053048 TaxID=3365694 RepID=UPI0037D6A1AB
MPSTDRLTCAICPRPLWSDEQHRYACHPCEQRMADELDQLPGLITELHSLLTPGVRSSTPRLTTRTSTEPQAPLNLGILDRITATTATLDSWLTDWHDHLGWQAPTYRTDPLTEAAAALRNNLPWAVEHHPAIDDFAFEIRDLHRDTTGLINPTKRPRRVGQCPAPSPDSPSCGAVLRYVPGATNVTCRWCRTSWDALDLGAALALAL